MSENVISTPLAASTKRKRVSPNTKGRGELRAYLLLTLLIAVGFWLRDRQLITPESGIGYWLGIVGASLMAALLLYPLRKRIRFLHMLGPTRYWFQMHMVFGLVGPLLILYHCNFQLGSFNSKIALYCMLLVAGSGIIGRHFYAAIHRGLYGRRTSLGELQAELTRSVEQGHGLANLMPGLVARLDAMSAELKGSAITQTLGIGRSIRWTFTHYFVRLSLLWTARQELQRAAANSEIVARDRMRIYRTTARYIKDYTTLFGRVAQYSFYERLFALWHVLHLPIFFMMVLSVLVHVLAVHMY